MTTDFEDPYPHFDADQAAIRRILAVVRAELGRDLSDPLRDRLELWDESLARGWGLPLRTESRRRSSGNVLVGPWGG